jgi:hypothetical protein
MTPTARDWLDLFAREVGTDSVGETELDALLALAGVAAHASERAAAPITCWLAARAGVEPARALEIARRLADELAADGA